MNTLSAILLSAALVLGASAVQKESPDAAGKLDSFFLRMVQAAAQLESQTEATVPTTAPAPAPRKNVAIVENDTPLYSSYSQTTRILAQLQEGDELYILRKASFSSGEWVYATYEEEHVSGWVLISDLKMPEKRKDADLKASGSDEYVPAYAKMGIVSTDQLNIRTAPGTGFDRIGCYRSGDRVGIIETNSGWGRTTKGWVYLDYVYMDGQVGRNPMVGNVTTEQLNIRSGPGLSYPICGSQRQGDRLLILEQIYAEGYYWGCTRLGWVCMSYVAPDYIPGTKTPIYGYGVIDADSVKVFPKASTKKESVGKLTRGSVVAILQTKTVSGKLWGQTSVGWIRMTHVDMRAIYAQAITPPAPMRVSVKTNNFSPDVPPETTPPVTEPPATEAPTQATEATQATETTEATQATEATEATQATEATEVTEATEAAETTEVTEETEAES